MVSAAGLARLSSHGLALAGLGGRQEIPEGEIVVSAMWLVPAAIVGAAVVMLVAMSRKK
jgi:hypothetical protein